MKKYKLETMVGIFVFIGLLSVGYLTVKLGKMEILGDDYYALEAKFTSVAGLRSGSSVEIAGVPVGRVERVTLDQNRYTALVELQVRKGVEVTDDSIASIKTSGLIGDKYVSISPGGSDIILEPGETIIETQAPVDIESLISKYVFGNVEKKNE